MFNVGGNDTGQLLFFSGSWSNLDTSLPNVISRRKRWIINLVCFGVAWMMSGSIHLRSAIRYSVRKKASLTSVNVLTCSCTLDWWITPRRSRNANWRKSCRDPRHSLRSKHFFTRRASPVYVQIVRLAVTLSLPISYVFLQESHFVDGHQYLKYIKI